MDIEKFIKRRKELGYSQSELAKGICTQATISKFENNGKMISTKILTQLCQRLGLSLSDIFPSQSEKDSAVRDELQRAEFDLITTEYDEALDILSSLDIKSIDDKQIQMEYLFIRGYALALSNRSSEDAIFCFDQILNGYDESHTTVYSPLAYVGMGISYQQAGNFDKAEFYFSKMPKRLKTISNTDVDSVWKSLTMLFYTGNFYSAQNEMDTSNMLLQSLINLSSERHVTFYVARAQYHLAENEYSVNGKTDRFVELINDATAFARFNKNNNLLKQIDSYNHSIQ
ncbi:helix-turn-helix domain protein [Lentilactobacillus sunkii]|jgi:transcriptional regulator with XRE-family HTH domain|uniref:Helix-turn-helix domain protein n=1 Tax=Lentilactobacillus sunkii TaxID=481719 RepID=A0A1E7XAR8_9LACO|nr:helix-turn-helix transcriptional regulator [Lentilactobacillus sunkii]OFA10216.1 helix-turn-helix domain protein [Lentilactobacillus sunkii]